MRSADRFYLSGLCLFAAVAFLPLFREPQVAGVSVFGWLMAALMVISPMGALALFLSERRRPPDSRDDPAHVTSHVPSHAPPVPTEPPAQ